MGRILAVMAGGTLVRELAAGALVDATFAVSRKERRTRRDGRPFLDLELTDSTGRVRARVWDGVPVLEQRFEVGDTVRVLGRVGEYAGKVELDDIRAKLGEIRGDIDEVTEDAKPYLMYAAVAGAVALVVIAFVAGKRRGRRKSTWVEIKRL